MSFSNNHLYLFGGRSIVENSRMCVYSYINQKWKMGDVESKNAPKIGQTQHTACYYKRKKQIIYFGGEIYSTKR